MDVDLWKSATQDDLTPQNLTAVCDYLFEHGEGDQAVQMAVQVGRNTQDVPLMVAATGVLSKYTAQHEIIAAFLEKTISLIPETNNELVSLRGELQIFLADAIMAMGHHDAAVSLFLEIVKTYPHHRVLVGEHLSMSLLEAGLAEQAETILKAWLAEGPASVALYNNLGCALERLNRSDEAIAYYQKGVELAPIHPSMSFGYGITLLKAGRFEEGFKRYAMRDPFVVDPTVWFVKRLPRLTPDTALQGKSILFYQEQGLGDTIQFIRFLPQLLQKGARATIALPRQLLRIMRDSFPDVDVQMIGDIAEHPETEKNYQFACPIPDLPYICGMTSEQDIPPFRPYLHVAEHEVERFSQLMKQAVQGDRSLQGKRRPRIGLVWAGEQRFKPNEVASNKRRSTSFRHMIDALAPADADFFNVQFGERRQELAEGGPQPVYDVMDEVHDMADTAALMKNLDLVISVDTAPLHLAAALGMPVWLVSRWDACWRWKDQGEDSAWYPTVRIFRAQEASFEPILSVVGQRLKEWLAQQAVQ